MDFGFNRILDQIYDSLDSVLRRQRGIFLEIIMLDGSSLELLYSTFYIASRRIAGVISIGRSRG